MPTRKVLFIGSKSLDESLCRQLSSVDWDIHVALSLSAAGRLISEQDYLVGFVVLAEADALACTELDAFLQAHSDIEWVGGFDAKTLQLQECRDLIFERMFDHVTLPVDGQRLAATLGHAYGRATLRPGGANVELALGAQPIVGQSSPITRLLRQIQRVANVDAPALICGESGTGKELVARAIHNSSTRADAPFVVVNCGAIPASLIQSELFGHEKGSFTGADRQRRGLIETANHGTLFLDEIGDLPLDMQTNLLRFLQEST
ncbi:MAG TPA: sigma 54-interacting transcriptional regulator, partial [Burkholderiaceae bacterium]|nr:sigma 54-interacting transcriptional regulator [Burkholderiaceae bacterium]